MGRERRSIELPIKYSSKNYTPQNSRSWLWIHRTWMRWVIRPFLTQISVGSCKNRSSANFKRQASEEWEAAYWHTKDKEFAVFVIAIMTLTQHSEVFGGIKGEGSGWGDLPKHNCCFCSSLQFPLKKETWAVALKTSHAKCIPCKGVLWEVIIRKIIHAILLAEPPKAAKEPGGYEFVISLSPSLCFGA